MPNNLDNIRSLVEQGELREASDALLKFASEYCPRFKNEAIGCKSRVWRVYGDSCKGILSSEDTERLKNRITYSMLELIDLLEQTDNSIPAIDVPSLDVSKGQVSSSRIDNLYIFQPQAGDIYSGNTEIKRLRLGRMQWLMATLL